MKINLKKLTIILYLILTNIIMKAQNPFQSNLNNQKISEKEFMEAHRVLPIEKSIVFQLSTMVAKIHMKSFAQMGNYVDGGFTKSNNKIDYSLKIAGEYYFADKLGAGASFNNFKNTFSATKFVGTIYHPGSEGWFWSSAGYFQNLNDNISVETTGHECSAFAVYKLANFSKKDHQLFEISVRAGLSAVSITEDTKISAFAVYRDSTNIYLPVIGYDQGNMNCLSNKVGMNCFLNAQILIHATKYFSFILGDFTRSFGIINPTFQQTDAVTNDTKTVSVEKHKYNSGGFTYAFGLAAHF